MMTKIEYLVYQSADKKQVVMVDGFNILPKIPYGNFGKLQRLSNKEAEFPFGKIKNKKPLLHKNRH